MARWTHANVLSVESDARRLWQFLPDNKFALAREFTARNGEALPPALVAKDWHTLWQPKLNIAWLPPEKVFLRVLQLPVADFAETLAMVELQLEKLSPLPVAQIVWTIEILSKRELDLQNVIVVIVARSLVEEFLGQLEAQKYQPDRIELPLLEQLISTQVKEDGVWLFPGETNTSPCLVAWFYGGILRNVSLLAWTNGADAASLKEQLAQMAWAGELEGWLTAPPKWHLIADESAAPFWEPILKEVAGEAVQVVAPVPPQQLAALSAKRAVQANKTGVGLLPADYTTRYRQQFVDRLWMRGLFGIVVLYLVGVLVYFSALLVLKFQLNKVQVRIASVSAQYTNTIQMKERVEILQQQANLKFAGLECWRMAAGHLPAELTLSRLGFQGGEKLTLAGTVSPENQSKLNDFYEAVLKDSINGVPIQAGPLVTPAPSMGPNGTQVIRWSFVCTLGDKGKK